MSETSEKFALCTFSFNDNKTGTIKICLQIFVYIIIDLHRGCLLMVRWIVNKILLCCMNWPNHNFCLTKIFLTECPQNIFALKKSIFQRVTLLFGVYLVFRKIKTLKNTPNHRRDPLKKCQKDLENNSPKTGYRLHSKSKAI